MKSKLWIIGYLVLVVGALTTAGAWVVKVDPFFHYHKPYTEGYYYNLLKLPIAKMGFAP